MTQGRRDRPCPDPALPRATSDAGGTFVGPAPGRGKFDPPVRVGQTSELPPLQATRAAAPLPASAARFAARSSLAVLRIAIDAEKVVASSRATSASSSAR